MEHFFELPVTYKDEELLFNGRLVTFAFDYKFYVNVNGRELVFEQDDEEHLRVIAPSQQQEAIPDPELVKKIAEVLKNLRQR
ncbi:MAG TPA: hypothetical protein VF421_04265 [Niabella sp.]